MKRRFRFYVVWLVLLIATVILASCQLINPPPGPTPTMPPTATPTSPLPATPAALTPLPTVAIPPLPTFQFPTPATARPLPAPPAAPTATPAPTEVLPAVPTPTPPAGAPLGPTAVPSARHLELGLKITQPQTEGELIAAADVLGTPTDPKRAAAILAQLPQGKRMLMTASYVGLEQTLDSLGFPITYLGYDIEGWALTSREEQADPPAAVQKMQQIAHQRGLILLVAPSAPINQKYGEQMVKYADIYAPQAKVYQATMSTEEYWGTLRPMLQALHAANPNARLFLDISPDPKGQQKSVEEMQQSLQGIRGLIDGVWVTYMPPQLAVVQSFVKTINGTQ